ncbi:MAG: tripartite tricarboxylate transporter TctB family protein [Firmicutes bacterium]|nr:tripartite tricarboxylate transporter TctB family protein [Bacillota bacterium]
MASGDLIMSLVILVVAIALYLTTFTFPVFPQYRYVDSGFWPKIVLAVLIFLAIMLVIESVRKKRHLQVIGQGGVEKQEREGLVRMLGAGALLLVYIFIGLQYVGFVLSTLLFTVAFMVLLGNRRPLPLVLTPLLITGLSVAVFSRMLLVPLPRGVGIFYLFSFLFY